MRSVFGVDEGCKTYLNPAVTKFFATSKGITFSKIAAKLGVSKTLVSFWANGLWHISSKNLRRLSKILGTNEASLVDKVRP